MLEPIAIAVRGKRWIGSTQRAFTLGRRYGLSPIQMARRLTGISQVLEEFQCEATLPITAAALARHAPILKGLARERIELAAHGYVHIDHGCLSDEAQVAQFERARETFERLGIPCRGFRAPYARWNRNTLVGLRHVGWEYDSSAALAWPLPNETPSYKHALDFYGARRVSDYPSLPGFVEGLVQIPFALPDDEALVERLSYSSSAMTRTWVAMLQDAHARGEMLVLNLHPERFDFFQQSLKRVIETSRELMPRVWIARLDEITTWWRERLGSKISIRNLADNAFEIEVTGPPGTALLARGVRWKSSHAAWDGQYMRAREMVVRVYSDSRPFIGIAPRSAPSLTAFLREQGFIVETSADASRYRVYLDRPHFTESDQRSMLAYIENKDIPLVRLGRWFDGARCALCITGDIDALTLGDYAMRLVGK